MKIPPGCDVPAVVSYLVDILVFQGGDWDDVYAVGALIGDVTRDFDFSIRVISCFHYERFNFSIKADFYISMSRYERLHSGGVEMI